MLQNNELLIVLDKDQSHDDTLQDADANYKESSASVLNDNSKSQKECV
jgi:hypothetical protein